MIPIYNVEEFVEKNIQSLCLVEYDSIEFIYVNDGSTDNCADIVQSYALNDNRIKLVNKSNGGLSDARNYGIKEATGKWITFVDGDDYVDSALFSEFISKISDDLDVVWGGYTQVPDGFDTCTNRTEEIKNGIEWFEQGKADYCACIYLIRKDLLINNDIWFPKGFLHEDMDFVPRLFLAANKILYSPISYYRYVYREGSISNTRGLKRSIHLLKIANGLDLFFKENYSQYYKHLSFYICFLCRDAIHLAIISNVKVREILKSNDVDIPFILNALKNSNSIKDKMLFMCMKLKLYSVYSLIYKKYRRIIKT